MRYFIYLSKIPKHIGKIKVLVFFLILIPLLTLIVEFYQQNLGLDPLDRLTRLTGKSALILLILSLVITPLRHFLTLFMVYIKADYGKRLADWNWIIKLRRMLGVMSFFYAALHLSIYFWLDQGMSLSNTFYDVLDRNFIALGFIAFVMLIPLVVTSTNGMMRRLGKKWRYLHRTVYIIVILSVAHFWMLTKVGVYDPLPYLAIVIFLLGWRGWYYWTVRKDKFIDDGMETIDRKQINRIVQNFAILSEKTFGKDDGKSMASMLLKILSCESHFSECIMKIYGGKIVDADEDIDVKVIVTRLKAARKNSKSITASQSSIELQTSHSPELPELMSKIDRLLTKGIKAEEENDQKVVTQVWTSLFSELLPID